RSGRACFTLTSASSAFSAVATWKPFLVRMSLRYWRSVGESSTTRTFLMGIRSLFSVQVSVGGCGNHVGLDVQADRLEQALFGERLGQVAVGTGETAAGAVENPVLAGEHDHRGRLEVRVLLDERAGLITVEPRHHDVDEDHLRAVVADLGQRIESVFGEDDVVSGLAQEQLRAPTNSVAVVNDEDFDRAGRRVTHGKAVSSKSRLQVRRSVLL